MSFVSQIKKGELYELSPAAESELKASKYYNEDLAPTKVKERTWTTRDVADLWLGLSVSIPALALASSLVALGVSPLLAIINVILGNLIILIPIQLNSHVGTKYGIPYPIYARLTFGTKGAQLSSVSRSIIGCGWTSVQCWVGGGAVAALIGIFISFFADNTQTIALPGNDSVVIGQLIGFVVFVLVCGWVAYTGMDKIKWVQNIGGPILIVVILALLIWSCMTISASGHSVLDVFREGNNAELIEKNGGFAFVYLAGLTGNIAYWATVALNIPDFSKMAKSQKDQFNGQMIGMPVPMAVCAIAGALFAQATMYAYGEASFDPTTVFYYVDNKIAIAVCAIGVIVATLTTCVAANIVAPSNGWSNIAPDKISFKKGVVITIIISIFVTQPWFIYGSGASYIFTWLNNYGTIIAPVAAILCADYFVCKQKRVDVFSLYKGNDGRYKYSNGWNWCAIIAWAASFIIPLLGNTVFAFAGSGRTVPNFLDMIAANGYLFSFAVAFIVYVVLMRSGFGGTQAEKGFITEEEDIAMTKVE
ncbi:MAG: cytosine permease [Eubacteriales bacterium]|nr:cytosine permease [Eubacteriales bacterium]